MIQPSISKIKKPPQNKLYYVIFV